MARAGLQALNEDDIRALIADARSAADAARKSDQLDLVDQFGGAGDKTDEEIEREQPVAVSGWKRWKHARGYFNWRLLQHRGGGLYTTEYQVQWRREGSSHGGMGRSSIKESDQKSIAIAGVFWEMWSEVDLFAVKADKNTLLKALLPWMMKGLKNNGGDDQECQHLFARLQRRVLEKLEPEGLTPKKVPAAKKPPPPKPVSLAQLRKPPAWAGPMKLSYFVLFEGGKATLLKGWKDLSGLMFTMYDGTDNDVLRSMMDRKQWSDDTTGKPFDFGGIIVRITNVKARGWSK
jgi:hypothetical protein